MEESAARKEACREYQSSLEDLTFNSKPHINMLTILAEENLTFAKDIVAIIEAQISKVDENTRKSLFKLRSTWDEVFPLKKLYALDVKVNSVDPAWPIKPLPPTVNASIHVNPKFLKQSEEAPSPQPAPSQPPAVVTPPPVAQPVPAVSQSSLTQEQQIRQQLLAKQKQLLELQQKKIELELEQTKAQLAGGFVLPTVAPTSGPVAPTTTIKPTVSQPAPVVRPWIPPQNQPDPKPLTRDPRLNRSAQPAAPQVKEQPTLKKDTPAVTGSPALTPEKRPLEKSTRLDRSKTQKKESVEDKPKSKSLSPTAKLVQSKSKPSETEKSSDDSKKDHRPKKRPQDKTAEAKEDEQKEKRRCSDKKDREEVSSAQDLQKSGKGKMMNGLTAKRDLDDSADKSDFKSGGSARTHSRKRTRSRSRSRSPNSSPKRKERRSPKGRTRSSSPSPHKSGKPRRPRADEHGKTGRDDRLLLRKTQSDNRKSKSRSETRDSHSPLSAKETKDGTHRWRSGWEENKHTSKSSEDTHLKPGPQRHKPYSAPSRPSTPRTPKHRLSVDANLQIPDVLNSASKKDLLRKASKRLESGEISQEDFLSVVHRIKHFFQYQEEKQQRSESWDDSADDLASNNQSPQTDPPSSKSRPREAMDPAELSYYEHKSKLRKTQVAHRVAKQEWEGEDKPEDGEREAPEEKTGSGRTPSHPPPHKYRPDERRSKEREDPRPPTGPMIEEYNHGKEFPSLKSLQGLRFIRKVDPRESSEREWNSPLTERQRDEQKSGYDAPRRYPVDARQSDPRRPEIALPHGTVVHRNCPSPGSVDQPVPRFERERLSPIHQKDSTEMSPIPRFESPNSEHSDDAPLSLDAPAPHPHLPPKSILKRGGPLSAVRQHSNSPGHTPPHEPGPPLQRFDGPDPMVPPRPHPPGWYEDGPHLQGPGRFDGGRPPLHNVLERFDGPDGPHMPHGLVRGGDGMGRFDGHPPPQGPGRFEGPMGQQPPVRFANQGPGPSHFDPQHCFENSLAPGPGPLGFQQQRPVRFDGPPNQLGPMRFEGPSRFDGPAPRFDSHFEGQQGPPRFPPQHNMQPPMRPMGQPVYDNQMVPQQNFNMGPQRFPEPMNPTFPTGPMTFPAQPSLQQGNFNMQPAAAFNQSGPVPFYNTAAPSVGMQQPVNLMGNMNQPFLPQNTAPFRPQVPQVGVPPENHFGQVDVNDLLSKLISNGIIKPSQPEAVVPVGIEPTAAAPAAAPAVEEEEEEDQEEEEEDVPDLTNFTLDELKQRHESVVTKLYSGNQCCLCSMRFTAAQTDMYADHLDWHFRQNHAGKVASKKITHRRWYYTLTDWIEFEEIADLEERAKSHFFEKENEEEVQKNQAAAKEKEFQSVRAAKDQVGELCEICQEPFETYWVEEEEDWFLKDAVRVDDKNFHPSCFEDYKNTSYVDVTPSPKKLLTDHPLSAFVKMEEEESACTSCSAPDTDSVKQEVAAETAEVPFVKEEEEVLTEVQSENTA